MVSHISAQSYRSFNRVAKGEGGGKDHNLLKKICRDTNLLSKKCEDKWNKYRFTIRWDRIFQNIDKMQFKKPTI